MGHALLTAIVSARSDLRHEEDACTPLASELESSHNASQVADYMTQETVRDELDRHGRTWSQVLREEDGNCPEQVLDGFGV